MRQSQLFTKTRREAPKDEEAKNAQLLIRAGYVHKEMAGVYAYLPLGFRVLENIKRIVREEGPSLALSAEQGRQMMDANAALLPQALGDMLSTIANSQQSVLNSQSTVREVVGVVVQDNLGLKEENRKLRDRMLELERVLAEYQRREETRKERMENRLRALEGTVAALQQQIVQMVQIQRQPKRRGWW